MKFRKYLIIIMTGLLLMLLSGCGQRAVEKTGTGGEGETKEKTLTIGMAFSSTIPIWTLLIIITAGML